MPGEALVHQPRLARGTRAVGLLELDATGENDAGGEAGRLMAAFLAPELTYVANWIVPPVLLAALHVQLELSRRGAAG